MDWIEDADDWLEDAAMWIAGDVIAAMPTAARGRPRQQRPRWKPVVRKNEDAEYVVLL